MAKRRLDQVLAASGLATSRSQAENLVKLGQVKVNGKVAVKAGELVTDTDKLELLAKERYVSRAALKLASAAEALAIDFKNKIVLDVGSSTGGFTDYALRHGAKKVLAVDVGSNQLHPSLRNDPRIELHEQTDIRDFTPDTVPNIVLIDVSFISLREVLPSVKRIGNRQTQIVAMVKPQFEASAVGLKHKGVIKNERLRRQILKDFETGVKANFVIISKADSEVPGAKGNLERFYSLRISP